MKPAVVIPIFQRTHSLRRLLASLVSANYSNYGYPTLVLVADGGHNEEVIREAERFNWPGHKELIVHKKQLGLEDNLMFCAGLTNEHGSVIILEDDTFVSTAYYHFACQAAEEYASETNVAGISLYRYANHSGLSLPFIPYWDGHDCFFQQKCSTYGQLFTKDMWQAFKDWLGSNDIKAKREELCLPPEMLSWESYNWELFYNLYLIDTGKYFVFPYHSLATVFGEQGEHMKDARDYHFFQGALSSYAGPWRWAPMEEGCLQYDAFFEPSPSFLKRMQPSLKEFDFDSDLYGLKPLGKLQVPYLLTSKKGDQPALSFGRSLKPIESNILFSLVGKEIGLFRRQSVKNTGSQRKRLIQDLSAYLGRSPRLKDWLRFKLRGSKPRFPHYPED